MENICSKCGKCCKGFFLDLSNLDPDLLEYLELHRCIMTKFGLWVPLPCQKLTKDNKCSIHKTKPKFCENFYCFKEDLQDFFKKYPLIEASDLTI